MKKLGKNPGRFSDAYYLSKEWRDKRSEILKGWNGFCQRCDELTSIPHVHHKGNKTGIFLILCSNCHELDHADWTYSIIERVEKQIRVEGALSIWEKGAKVVVRRNGFIKSFYYTEGGSWIPPICFGRDDRAYRWEKFSLMGG
jgi:hypothetical protein